MGGENLFLAQEETAHFDPRMLWVSLAQIYTHRGSGPRFGMRERNLGGGKSDSDAASHEIVVSPERKIASDCLRLVRYSRRCRRRFHVPRRRARPLRWRV
jgi:hypothetical protein